MITLPTSDDESMNKEERLSAVAKRRRLNGSNVSSKLNSPSARSRSQSPATIPLAQQETSVTSKGPYPSEGVQEPSHNTFSALVGKDVVQFSNFREIEIVNTQAVKIRLSKGQKCYISGRYSLWIKGGAIEIFGAKLESSSELFYVYAPLAFEVPAIVALTDILEVEIRSQVDSVSMWTGFNDFEWFAQNRNDALKATFFVHGYSKPLSGSFPILKEFDGSIASDIFRRIDGKDHTQNRRMLPTILFGGKQLAGSCMLFICLINKLLTVKTTGQHVKYKRGLLLLDIDGDMPLFSPPGTSSLVHITKPILGPSYTALKLAWSRPLSQGHTTLQTQCFGPLHNTRDVLHWLCNALNYLKLAENQEYRECPLLMKVHNCFDSLSPNQIPEIAKKLLPSTVIWFGTDSGSRSQMGELIALESGAKLIDIPGLMSRNPPLNVQHELLIQSYFHLQKYQFGQQAWDLIPLEINQQLRKRLTYGTDSAAVRRISVPGLYLRNSDFTNALEGTVVAINLHKNTSNREIDKSTESQNDNIENDGGTHIAVDHTCLGLAIVAELDQITKEICLVTPVSSSAFENYDKSGESIELVSQRADLNGYFDTSWTASELEALVEETRPTKVTCRHRLQ